jgi:hypothetical protein
MLVDTQIRSELVIWRMRPGLHNIADQKIFEVGRKKWRVKLKSLERKEKQKERK